MIGTSVGDLVVTMSQTPLPAASPLIPRPVFSDAILREAEALRMTPEPDATAGGAVGRTLLHTKSLLYAYIESAQDNGENLLRPMTDDH